MKYVIYFTAIFLSISSYAYTENNGCPKDTSYIPPGEFRMGCSWKDKDCFENYELFMHKPTKHVKITKGFCMDKYEVTQGGYKRIMGEIPLMVEFEECGVDCPIYEVTWREANKYCKQIGKRLPTEAEWEYAARGRAKTKYYWGNKIDGSYEWYGDNSNSELHPVGKKKPNTFGLYDMLGNMDEWVQDCYEEDVYKKLPKVNPIIESRNCVSHVIRGGFYMSDGNDSMVGISVHIRQSSVDIWGGGGEEQTAGFRCAEDVE
ncbi:MAG: SUMF1/EgtB/PvdO family nonheme iron enzyme [bacterium]